MKRIAILLMCLLPALSLSAQNRKHIAHYSLFQQYFNPALTGYEGSVIKAFFRDQWVGFAQAPRTLFLSGELNLSDVGGRPYQRPSSRVKSLKSNHHVGMLVLRDTFGPYRDNQLHLSYGSRIPLSSRLSLRAGAALAYETSALDASSLIMDNANDPQYQKLLAANNNRLHKLDVHGGLTLTGTDFYVGYAIQDLARGRLNFGDSHLNQTYGWHHVLQGGYRRSLTEELGLVFTGIFRYDNKLQETLEGQLKGVWNDMFWLGGGYRKDLALTATAGFRLNQYRLAYAREIASGQAEGINAGTNELIISYNLVPVRFTRRQRTKLSVW